MLSKVIIALLLAAPAAARRPKSHELEGYSFEKFAKDYNLEYSGAELASRKALYDLEFARVQAHNAKNLSWKEGINKYSAFTVQEKKSSFGRHKGVAARQAKMLKSQSLDFQVKSAEELPASVDWREKGIVSAVKDQGHCGSCWAFAATATIESYVALNSGLLFDLSTQQMAMCAPNPDKCGGTGGCEGSTAELAFEYLSGSRGMYEEYQYSYTSYYGVDEDCKRFPGETSPVATINGFVKLPDNNATAVLSAVAKVGPLSINVDASTWHSYESGVFDGCNQASPDVNHVVVMVGYGEEAGGKYWLVRNSWSPTWGEKGYIKLLRADSAEQEACGSDVTPTDGVECEADPTPVKVCGTCGAIYDSSYPLNAAAL
eukprot:CAMPEP_0173184984 /NCGR_PEP_ID=MMETSP1141-20130122/9284_1 /TAXON_ID=483371 /ORGANISM="non described non described, Strain CCMP2298" /LENGTH=373 /DNA_ID=CAMNT_0014108425 /DNA_START=38 /DNA_END=1159 /DNA_ORIENTATION=-